MSSSVERSVHPPEPYRHLLYSPANEEDVTVGIKTSGSFWVEGTLMQSADVQIDSL